MKYDLMISTTMVLWIDNTTNVRIKIILSVWNLKVRRKD